MPVAVTSPSFSSPQHGLPNPAERSDTGDAESGSSRLPTDADLSSSSSLVSPMGSSGTMPFSSTYPASPISGFDTPAKSSPQPSVNVSNVAVDGSAPPNFNLRGMGLRLNTTTNDAGAPWPKGLVAEPLHEQEEDERVIINPRVVAVDFDDVCAQYIPELAANHNARYGTNLTLEDFQTYSFFQNKGWGSPAEVQRKLAILDASLPSTAPVKGFAAALRAIHALGHPIHIVTARPEMFKDDIIAWLGAQGITVGFGEDDVIAAIWCCSTYHKEELPERRDTASGFEEEKALNEKLLSLFAKGKTGGSKMRVLRAINASLFIDDNYGNLESIATAHPPIPCLLFGNYPWNRVRSGVATPAEKMTFDERTKAGLEITVEDIELGLNLARVQGWDEVVEWVRKWDAPDAQA